MKTIISPNKYVAKVVQTGDLKPYFDPVRIEGYCKGCPNYGKLWSCPPHGDSLAVEISPLERFRHYQHVLLIANRVLVAPGVDTMAAFQRHRRAFAKCLEAFKVGNPEPSDYLIAGNCYLCDEGDCARKLGEPCRFPERMTYSLEAIGYDVCGIAEGILDLKIEWTNSDGEPKLLTTVGAIFSDSKAYLQQLLDQFT